jgi:hypothetical protein
MRRYGWTRSIVPEGDDQTIQLALDDVGPNRRIWIEADTEVTDLETDLHDGRDKNPAR